MKTILLLVAMVLSFDAFALRCGSELINTGTDRYQVRYACGLPNDVVMIEMRNGDIKEIYTYRRTDGTTVSITIVNSIVTKVSQRRTR